MSTVTPPVVALPDSPLQWALLSLEGLSVGDAFGQCFFDPAWTDRAAEAVVPEAPWYYTDDTEMSLSVVRILARYGRIEQDALAESFAVRYSYDRAYGPSMHRVLARIAQGEDWREVTRSAFGGLGSFGNGAAMRAAPVGAFFHDDLARAVSEARASAEVTHAHPEAVSGAVAVSLAAAQACRFREQGDSISADVFLSGIIDRLPGGEVRSKLARGLDLHGVSSRTHASNLLGNGTTMAAQDTVPYALWCCAQSLEDYEQALWLALSAGGDRDTLCAIVGGVVACRVGIQGMPPSWLEAREPLPGWQIPSEISPGI